MPETVSLRRVADEISSLFEGWNAYLNRRTGELVTVSHDHLRAAEEEEDDDGAPGWEREILQKAKEILSDSDYLVLPDRFEIHDYEIMRRFGDSLQDRELGDQLLSLLHGSGAFRRFKDAVHRQGLADAWYRFREEAIVEVARGWLEENDIPFGP
jgi:hypothetical protein